MSRRAVTLPLRLAPSTRTSAQQWTCRRCLATQASIDPSTPNPPPIHASYGPNPSENYDPRLPAAERPKDPTTGNPLALKKTDFYLKKPMSGQLIPQQYLQHSTASWLHKNEVEQREKTVQHRKIVGVVVSAGKMAKTVKVRVVGRRWEPKIRKFFADHTNHLVHDPMSSLVLGDVVELHRLKVSKAVHHVVGRLVTPFGVPEVERPPIPTADERLAAYKKKRFAKLERRSLRQEAAKGDAEAIRELKARGLDPGQGVQAGKSEKANLQGKTRGSGKGAILGEKGQKLPAGVLPGGKHEVGKIDERAKHNRGRAMRLNKKAEENLVEAREKTVELQETGVSDDWMSSATLSRGRGD